MARTKPIHTPLVTPPPNGSVSPEIFPAMGEEAIFRMIRDFYQKLSESSIGHMFSSDPEGLAAEAERSGAFFVFLLGGPPLYQQRYGAPRMRQRHLAFEIDEAARQEWLRCFGDVLEDATEKYGFPAEHLEGFIEFLVKFSAWMVNAE
jgi:hemoglobin